MAPVRGWVAWLMTEIDDVRGGTGRSASTLELFFDLVYVFAITQVVGFIHSDPSAGGLAQGALLLTILWWTWSIYTWTTNWTGTHTTGVKLFMLATMGATLLMAAAVPEAFGEKSELFGVTLFTVRILVAALYFYASKDYPVQRAAFFTFAPISTTTALLFLVAGFLDDGWLLGLFVLGAVLDFISAANAGRGTWAVDAEHFAERNGLFIIIALGESVVGVGFVAAEVPFDAPHLSALVVAFMGVAALWWAYFDRAAPIAENAFKRLSGQAIGRFARDVYTLIHHPMVIGIIFFAVALEEVVGHPADPMPLELRFALAGGIALVLLSIVAGRYRAIGRLRFEQIGAAILLLSLTWVGGELPALLFAVVAIVITVASLVTEHLRQLPEVVSPLPPTEHP